MDRGTHIRTSAYPGVACWFLEDCETHYQCAMVRMIGDDRNLHVQADSIEPLDEEEFCSNCGQIGCGHG